MKISVCLLLMAAPWCVYAQNTTPPSVSQVIMYSGVKNVTGQDLAGNRFSLNGAVPTVYTEANPVAFDLNNSKFLNAITTANTYKSGENLPALINSLNASIATALSVIPLSSPASGVLKKTDPVSGAELRVNSTLGPIFSERAETIGKGQFYVGVSHQDYHFTQFNGQSLNSLVLASGGGTASGITGAQSGQTAPSTYGIGLDVRLSQNIAFITYGVTNNFDMSVGLPLVHAAVAARTHDATVYAGTGNADSQSRCWCLNTLAPGYPTLQQHDVSQSQMSKSGFGDLLIRAKGKVYSSASAVVAVGGDVRFPTGDEKNYLGIGTTSVKPFVAVSLYSKPIKDKIIISPHADAGWQFSGKSILGGTIQGTQYAASAASGGVSYIGAPFIQTKGYLPDVFTWAVGAEVAVGRHNTLIADILGNNLGWIHGIPNTVTQNLGTFAAPTGPNGNVLNGSSTAPQMTTVSGLGDGGRISYGQYNGSFGYKTRVWGNMVANFNLLVRLDNNGLTARVTPLFGLGYSF